MPAGGRRFGRAAPGEYDDGRVVRRRMGVCRARRYDEKTENNEKERG